MEYKIGGIIGFFKSVKDTFNEMTTIGKLLIIIGSILFIAPIVGLSISAMMLTILWLMFPSNSKGIIRGLFSFVYASIAQFYLLIMSFVIIAFNDSGDILTFTNIAFIFIISSAMLIPVYLLIYRGSKLKVNQSDGITYILLIISIHIVKAIWWASSFSS